MLAIYRDITQLKEQQAEAEQARTRAEAAQTLLDDALAQPRRRRRHLGRQRAADPVQRRLSRGQSRHPGDRAARHDAAGRGARGDARAVRAARPAGAGERGRAAGARDHRAASQGRGRARIPDRTAELDAPHRAAHQVGRLRVAVHRHQRAAPAPARPPARARPRQDGAGRGGGGQPGQVDLPRHHEPRDPHADERRGRHRRAARARAAERAAAAHGRHDPRARPRR